MKSTIRFNSSCRTRRCCSSLFEPIHETFLLEHHFHRLNNSNLWICFAIDNDSMLELLRAGYIEEVLLCQTIVPAAIPGGKPIGVTLPSTGKLGAGSCLHVDVPLGVGVCCQVGLSLTPRTRHCKDRRRN